MNRSKAESEGTEAPGFDEDGPRFVDVAFEDVELELDWQGREACSGVLGFGAVLSPQMIETLRRRRVTTLPSRRTA
jgi:hypothetical protein